MPEELSTIPSAQLRLLTEKADAFDRLVYDLATLLPPDATIKKLAGLPLLEALKDYQLVPKPPATKPLKDMTLDELYELEAKHTATIGHR